jgi:hypothetical protein
MAYKNDRRFRPNTVGNTALLAGPCAKRLKLRLHLFQISHVLNQLGEPIALSADGVASDVTAGRCGHASAVDHVHTRAAGLTNSCDRVVGLRKLCERHGLGGCPDGQGEDKSDQPGHSLLRVNLQEGHLLSVLIW